MANVTLPLFSIVSEAVGVAGMKRCSCCGDEMPAELFHTDSSRADGKFADCRRCNNLRRKFHNSDAYWRTVNRLFAEQGGRCPICGEPIDLAAEVVALDHPHRPAAMRSLLTYREAITGLLHRSCNLALGHLGDDPATAARAAVYLIDTRGPT